MLSLVADSVPLVIFVALVVSVVAEFASPVILVEAKFPVIFVLANDVIHAGLAYVPLVYTPFVTVPELPVMFVVNVPELLANL